VYQYCEANLILAQSALNTTTDYPSWNWNFGAGKIIPDMALTEKPLPPQFDTGDKSFNITLLGGSITTLTSAQDLLPPNSVDDIQAVIVEATAPLRASQSVARNSFKYLAGYPATLAAPLALATDYNIRFNGPAGLTSGMKLLLRISTVNKNGLRSDPVEVTVQT
jgi:hypothetical protein